MQIKGYSLFRERNEYGRTIRKLYEKKQIAARMKDIRDWNIRRNEIANTITTVNMDILILEIKGE